MSKSPATRKFQKLIDDLSSLYETARKVHARCAWEMGRRVVEEMKDGEVRAAYGKQLIQQISKELSKKYGPGFSERNLDYMCRVYIENKIPQPAAELTWTNQVELLRIKDPKVRKNLEKRAINEGLTKYEVRQIVTNVNSGNVKPVKELPPLKHPTGLKLNTYAQSKLKAKLKPEYVLIDCGFFVNKPIEKKKAAQLTIMETPSYTYWATIDRVIDGDTLQVLVDVGFETIMYDKLRLRGINCPEMGTPEGDRAKRFVEKCLPVGAMIVLKSHKTRVDLHGRFVVDVLFKTGVDDPDAIIKRGTYLNQLLLDEGHAVRMKE